MDDGRRKENVPELTDEELALPWSLCISLEVFDVSICRYVEYRERVASLNNSLQKKHGKSYW